MIKSRKYDENGRSLIREYLKDCKKIADLGCNEEKIREDAIGYDIDGTVEPDFILDFNDGIFPFSLVDSYDGICASHLLEHVIDTRTFLSSCYKGLNEGGRIAIICPDGESVSFKTLGDSDLTHEMLFTPKTLKLYLEHTGFRNVQAYYYDRPYAHKQTKGIFACGVKK